MAGLLFGRHEIVDRAKLFFGLKFEAGRFFSKEPPEMTSNQIDSGAALWAKRLEAAWRNGFRG